MDFEQYKNSKCIIDKSGTQPLFYFPYDNKFKPLEFFLKKEIVLVFADSSLAQQSFQDYPGCRKTLFTGTEIVSESITSKTGGDQGDSFVICKTNGTITRKSLEPLGYPVNMVSLSIQTLSLWDTTAFMSNSDNNIDKQIIHSARNEEKNNKKVFILTGDKGIIKQIKMESLKFFRPIDVLKWMVEDKFISQQKGVSVFERWKSYNWTCNLKSFKEI